MSTKSNIHKKLKKLDTGLDGACHAVAVDQASVEREIVCKLVADFTVVALEQYTGLHAAGVQDEEGGDRGHDLGGG